MAGCTMYRPPKIGHMTIKEKLGFLKTQKLHVGGGGEYMRDGQEQGGVRGELIF